MTRRVMTPLGHSAPILNIPEMGNDLAQSGHVPYGIARVTVGTWRAIG